MYSYDLSIDVTRHGPKKGFSGPLTPPGRLVVRDHYVAAGFQEDTSTRRRVISSGVVRALETVEIRETVIQNEYGVSPVAIEKDERLSERNLLDFIQTLTPVQAQNWFRYWYLAARRPQPHIWIGPEVVRGFSGWLEEKVEEERAIGGRCRIDAFSHGPTMAGFTLFLEEKLGQEILPPVAAGQDRLDFDRLFSEPHSAFPYLGSMTFRVSWQQPEVMQLVIGQKVVTFRLMLIRELGRAVVQTA